MELAAQLMMFEQQEAWLVAEFSRVNPEPPGPEREAQLREIFRRSCQLRREFSRFLGPHENPS